MPNANAADSPVRLATCAGESPAEMDRQRSTPTIVHVDPDRKRGRFVMKQGRSDCSRKSIVLINLALIDVHGTAQYLVLRNTLPKR